jgi:hypothetical protein
MAYVKWKSSSTYHIPTMYGRHIKFADGRESWDDGAGGPASMACGRKAPRDNDYFAKLPEGAQVCTGCGSGPGVVKKDPKAEQARLSAVGEAALKAITERQKKAAHEMCKDATE